MLFKKKNKNSLGRLLKNAGTNTGKHQCKFMTVRVQIALCSFTVSLFDKGLWMYILDNIPVHWFPGSWTLNERQSRSRFHLSIYKFPGHVNAKSLWQKNTQHQLLLTYHAKSFSLIHTPKGEHWPIAYFDSVETYKGAHLKSLWVKEAPPKELKKNSSKECSSRVSTKASDGSTLNKELVRSLMVQVILSSSSKTSTAQKVKPKKDKKK